MLMMEDLSIICDLRQNNGFKGTKFNTFWDEMGAYFNEVIVYFYDYYFILFFLKIFI